VAHELNWPSFFPARCNGGAEDAEILVQRMREDGIPLDEVTYLAIIDCVSRRAMRGEASLDDAWAVVDEMKAMGIEPTARTYGALISVCTR
jgi:pentatricopeptide repeat protein